MDGLESDVGFGRRSGAGWRPGPVPALVRIRRRAVLAEAPVPAFTAETPEAHLRTVRARIVDVVLGLDLFFTGLGVLLGALVGLSLVIGADAGAGTQPDPVGYADLWTLQAFNFLLIGAVPLAWVLGTRRRAWLGTVRYLGLQGAGRGALLGVGLSGWLLLGVALVLAVVSLLPEPVQAFLGGPSSAAREPVPGMGEVLDWPLAVFLALTAGVGEEILFRGVLQRWMGVWPQAILFVAAHMGNGFPLQWVIALGMGVAFGYLRQAGWSLVALMAAHAAYDLFLLGWAIAASA